MSNLTRALMMGAAGAAGDSATYVDDVFSTYLKSFNGSTNIVNNIDLAGEGGLVWTKIRNNTDSHYLADTVNGVNKTLMSNSSNSLATNNYAISAFNNNGFTYNDGYGGPKEYATWTFRKAPGFFDVVNWTGNGVDERLIPHNLGSTPGMIMVKCTSNNENWIVWHRNIATTSYLQLNTTDALLTGIKPWGSNTQTINSTHFSVNNYGSVNSSGRTYVAYVFAHDDAQYGTGGDESIIKCGTYTGTAATNNTVNLGFEPQWVMLKSTTSGNSQPWFLLDNMRGAPSGGNDFYLFANDSQAETDFEIITFNSTGFSIEATGNGVNGSGQNYIYMAIRRPNKPPSAGTEVFKAITRNGTQADVSITGFGFVPDLFMSRARNNIADQQWQVFDRSRGPLIKLTTRYNSAESSTANSVTSFDQDGISMGSDASAGGVNYNNGQYVYHTFSRAPGFFDTVTYTGAGGGSRNITHNLDATPGMIWIKRRTGGNGNWTIWSGELSSSTILQFTGNPTNPEISVGTSYINSATNTTFNVGGDYDVNKSGDPYIAYLFGSLNGISKVGSYSGTGNDINVDCGFTAGARYVLIKRKTGGNGGWYVWDTTRGIVSGNDPYLFIDGGAIEVTNTDYIDPLNSGFTVTSSAPAEINASGSTYLFFAIA